VKYIAYANFDVNKIFVMDEDCEEVASGIQGILAGYNTLDVEQADRVLADMTFRRIQTWRRDTIAGHAYWTAMVETTDAVRAARDEDYENWRDQLHEREQ
jgi:hypothetical protein